MYWAGAGGWLPAGARSPPARIPFIGGKRIRPLAAVIPALLGGLTLTVLFGSVPLGGGHSLTAFGVVERVSYDNGWWNALAMICTAPLGVWGPAVVVLAIAYYLRRRPRPAPSCCCPMSKWNANGNRHRDEGSRSFMSIPGSRRRFCALGGAAPTGSPSVSSPARDASLGS